MGLIKKIKTRINKIINPSKYGPYLGDKPYGGPDNCPFTYVHIVRSAFHIHGNNASSTISLGFCRGFEQAGIRFQIVSSTRISKILPKLKEPFIFLGWTAYLDMKKADRILLRKYPHFVSVIPNPGVLKNYYDKTYNLKIPEIYDVGQEIFDRVLDSRPNFVTIPTPLSAKKFYSKWESIGFEIKSIPLACDTIRYFKQESNKKYSNTKMAFVGGYWKMKSLQFDKYLKPYEEILTVFGYNKWPYKGYQGILPNNEERLLYQNARVSPAISEPHAEYMGDIVERAFKVLGSGGLAITDVVPFYRDLFKSDELLVPKNIEEYHVMVDKALNDDSFNKKYREKGYKAVMERHTYLHRAKEIMGYLGIEL